MFSCILNFFFALASDFNTACSVNNDKTSYCAEKHAPTCDFNRKIDRIEYLKCCLQDKCSAVHSFWPVEFSNGRLGASHLCSDSVMFGLMSSVRLRKYSWPRHSEVPSKWTFTPRHFTTPSRPVRQVPHLPKTKQRTVMWYEGVNILAEDDPTGSTDKCPLLTL